MCAGFRSRKRSSSTLVAVESEEPQPARRIACATHIDPIIRCFMGCFYPFPAGGPAAPGGAPIEPGGGPVRLGGG